MKHEVRELLNRQINEELFSAYLYLNFSDIFAEAGLRGFSRWFRVQALEEVGHGIMILEYLEENGEPVELGAIREPGLLPDSDDRIRWILVESLNHEKEITQLINRICEAADRADDLRTLRFLDWFIREQAEEESKASDLIQEYDLFGDNPASLYLMDKVLGERRVETPSALVPV